MAIHDAVPPLYQYHGFSSSRVIWRTFLYRFLSLSFFSMNLHCLCYNSFDKIAQFALRKRCPYLELFWSVFSRIRTEYGDLSVFSPNAGKCGPE